MKIQLKPNKYDVFVIAFTVILIVLSIVLSFSNSNSKANIVVIKYDNEVVHKMNLQVDETFTMKKEDYDLLLGDLTIQVKNGKVAVVEQTSNYNYCEIMGEVDKPGTAIICAPNGVVITIEGYEKTDCDWGPCLGGDE